VAGRSTAKTSIVAAISLPPQQNPAIDPSTGALDKNLWLALKANTDATNLLSAASGAPATTSDNFASINGVDVTY
jgi:hypothetical protein